MIEDVRDFEKKVYDLCIIGGGIYGAWAAWDASLRGLSVALVDKGDWGSATSQSSSKLIHGGLRYLEQFEFGLVRKSLKERDVLSKVIPNLVKPLRFVVPVYLGDRVGPFKLMLGLKVYDQLAGQSRLAKPYGRMSEEETFAKYPWLKRESFKAALEYSDAQTDDSRLCFQVIQSSIKIGVDAQSYVEANVSHTMEQVKRVRLKELDTGVKAELKCKSILMGTGPWKDGMLGGKGVSRETSRLTKGVHLILPDMGLDKAMTLTSSVDGRVFFIVPWYGRTMVGTTDTDDKQGPDVCRSEKDDVDYLLKSVNTYLEKPWLAEDVIATFSGLRVLQSNDGSHPSQASREWALPEIRPGVFRSIGGKLTSAREDASKAVDHMVECLGFEVGPSISHQQSLFREASGMKEWREELLQLNQLIHLDLSVIEHLLYRYGPNAKIVLSELQMSKDLKGRLSDELCFIYAEVEYICKYEPFSHLEDLLRRRMPLMILMKYDEAVLNKILERVKDLLAWSDGKCHDEKEIVKSKWNITLDSL